MSERSLAGYSVLVTRPLDQCDELVRRIEKAGGSPLVAPMLGIRAIADSSGARAVIGKLDEFDIAVFVSRNAVEFGFSLLQAEGRDLEGLEVYAVGLGTAAQLQAHGVAKVHTPRAVFSSEGLLELPGLAPAKVSGKRVVIFGGRDGRELLAESLKSRGAAVQLCEVYERFVPNTCLKEVIGRNNGAVPDIAVVTSLEGLNNLADKIAEESIEEFYDVPLLVVSGRIAEEVVKLGFTSEPLIVENPGDGKIVSALLEWAAGEL